MTNHDYKQNAYYLMYLIRCVLNNKIPAKEKIDKINLSDLLTVAKEHSLSAIAAYALESAGIYDKDFEEEKFKAIRKNIILDTEREAVLAELEKAGIWYMPLKGSILKDLYPQTGMRQMCDVDILFDNNFTDDMLRIMDDLGYQKKKESFGHDIEFSKEPVSCFEMHIQLFGFSNMDNMNQYYSDVKSILHKDENNDFGYHFSLEDFYIFLIAHSYKHFSGGGNGLRSLTDTYVYLTHYRNELDMKYIQQECEKLDIAEFEKQNRELALLLLGGKKLSQDESKLFDYYIFSGTYGNITNHVKNKLESDKTSAKIKYLFRRLLIPVSKKNSSYHAFANRYKWFYENRIRLPLLVPYRLGLALTKRRARMVAELKALKK